MRTTRPCGATCRTPSARERSAATSRSGPWTGRSDGRPLVCLRLASSSDPPGGADPVDALQPGPGLKPLEGAAGLVEHRAAFLAPPLGGQPLGVLEERHGEPEGNSQLAEQARSAL